MIKKDYRGVEASNSRARTAFVLRTFAFVNINTVTLVSLWWSVSIWTFTLESESVFKVNNFVILELL